MEVMLTLNLVLLNFNFMPLLSYFFVLSVKLLFQSDIYMFFIV